MAWKVIIFVLVICNFLPSREGAKIDNHIRVLEAYKSVYYDPSTNLTLPSEIEDAGRFPFTRIGFRGLPCACEGPSCGCCAGINITRLKFDQRACANFTYDPHDFAIRIQVAMNDREVLTSMLSAKNPPPVCAGLPMFPALQLCLRFHDLTMPAQNALQGCVDLETRFVQSPILVLHFDCIRIATDGITWIKPDEVNGGSLPVIDYPDPEPYEPETYDEVAFESSEVAEPPDNGTAPATLEDEEQIGQLKL